jgi:hypothetical protein
MAVLIRSDGWLTTFKPADGRRFTLDELQALVGGYIEVVHARGRRRWLVLNEEGRELMLKVNVPATRLYHHAGGSGTLVGDVVLATSSEMGGTR